MQQQPSQSSQSSTRIVDLDRQQFQHQHLPPTTRNERVDQSSTSYQHLVDIHPNPYGHSTQKLEDMRPPMPPRGSEIPRGSETQPNTGFPPNDMPKKEQSQITIDEQTRPNYIPQAHQTIDQSYLQQYEKNTQREINEYMDKHKRESRLTKLWECSQIPIIVGLLFFMFNIPIISSFVTKYLTFMVIYDANGMFNISGLIFKSIAFGFSYYILNQIIILLQEI